jgi:hypothetical protein
MVYFASIEFVLSPTRAESAVADRADTISLAVGFA